MPNGASDLVELIAAHDRHGLADAVTAIARAEGIDTAIAALCTVQAEVGRRWQLQQWNVADEHAATALVDFALVAATADRPDRTRPPGTIVVVCAEEEWHVLPARMVAELFRARGWDVTFLGASIPAGHLEPYLVRHSSDAVALSCSVPIHLPGARRSIAAAHRAGVPVLVGGAAFGSDGQRATAVGADGWAPTVPEAHLLALAWLEQRPALAQPHADAAFLALAADHASIVDAAFTDLAARYAPMADYNAWQLAKTREDLDYMLRFTEAAVLTGDERIVSEFAGWLVPLFTARSLYSAATSGFRSLLRALPEVHAYARRLLERAIATTEAAAQHPPAT